ncbi:MAG: hypothetical protein K8J09_08235 [Planctomycetes bacterium]|nr:hypothetical protein [Planctomycetota bacterium]
MRRRPPWGRLAATLLLGTACNSTHQGPAEVTTVLSTVPVDGATQVEPDTAILLELEVGTHGLQPGTITIHDGGNELRGTLIRVGESARWQWQPEQELPRGNRIHVRSLAQGEVASFTVREAVQREVFELPGEFPAGALSWPNGRRAVVMTSGRVFEVTAGALVERFVTVSPLAWTFGDGGFIHNELDTSSGTAINYCVRGDLDGMSERIATPHAREVSSIDSRGDAVLLVPNTVGSPAEHGIWRLMHDASTFELAGPLDLAAPDDAPGIAGAGEVSIAYLAAGEARFSRFAMGDLVGEHYTIAAATTAPRHAVDITGGAVIACTRAGDAPDGLRYSLHLARYEPATGVREVAADAGAWPAPSGSSAVASVRRVQIGAGGSAMILVDVIAGGYVSMTESDLVRLEADDRLGEVENYATRFAGLDSYRMNVSPGRCEMQVLSPGFEGLSLVLGRSRPGETYEPPHTAFVIAPSSQVLSSWCFAFDDSGRGVIATAELVWPGERMRIARFD